MLGFRILNFWSLLFVCYLGFVICNFHQFPPLYIKNEDELNPQYEILHAPCASIHNLLKSQSSPLSPLQLISENGEIVLLARLDQKEGLRGLLYTDNIICL